MTHKNKTFKHLIHKTPHELGEMIVNDIDYAPHISSDGPPQFQVLKGAFAILHLSAGTSIAPNRTDMLLQNYLRTTTEWLQKLSAAMPQCMNAPFQLGNI